MNMQYCVFYRQKKLQFGRVKEVAKKKLIVVTPEGDELSCSQNQMEYLWSSTRKTEKDALSHLRRLPALVSEESLKIDLDTIYELCEPGQSHTLEELANDFLENSEDGTQKAALLISLKNNNRLFQQKKNLFYVRTEEEILELDKKEAQKKETEEKKRREKEWADLLTRKQVPVIELEHKKHWRSFQRRLKNFLVYFEKSHEKNHFLSLFNLKNADFEINEKLLLNYMSLAGLPCSWGRLRLERAEVDWEFEKEEIEEAEKLRNVDIWKNPFGLETKDQRNLKTYTVDNEDSKDFDDALSWEEKEDITYIRVHIADVSSFIRKGGLLFEKAEKRLSSVYTVKQVFPMFPPRLSEDIFSLAEGRDRPTMTFEFEIDREGEIKNSSIYRSVIKVDNNYSYEEIDEAIQKEESFWPKLWDFCQRQKNIRVENGSIEIERIEVRLDISDPDNIKIKNARGNTPASMIIQELAILSNYKAAVFSKERGLNCLYRHQPPYIVHSEPEEKGKTVFKNINIKAAAVGLYPDAHSGLGLECYLQITSPIRRFHDLINQETICRELSNSENMFQEEELLIWAKLGEEGQRAYNRLQRDLLDRWKLKYLDQRKGEVFEARLERYYKKGKAQINILKLQLLVEAVVEGPEEDEIFPVIIDSVAPEYNRVTIRRHIAK